jgi:hypothetical protein
MFLLSMSRLVGLSNVKSGHHDFGLWIGFAYVTCILVRWFFPRETKEQLSGDISVKIRITFSFRNVEVVLQHQQKDSEANLRWGKLSRSIL